MELLGGYAEGGFEFALEVEGAVAGEAAHFVEGNGGVGVGPEVIGEDGERVAGVHGFLLFQFLGCPAALGCADDEAVFRAALKMREPARNEKKSPARMVSDFALSIFAPNPSCREPLATATCASRVWVWALTQAPAGIQKA